MYYLHSKDMKNHLKIKDNVWGGKQNTYEDQN